MGIDISNQEAIERHFLDFDGLEGNYDLVLHLTDKLMFYEPKKRFSLDQTAAEHTY